MLKNKIRKDYRKKLGSIDLIDRKTADIAICESLSTVPEIVNAEIIALYAAIEHEVDLSSFASDAIRCGKRLCYPRSVQNNAGYPQYEMAEVSDFNDLIPGRCGIREPDPECRVCRNQAVNVWLVPGVYFTVDGIRLGRGGGVYDRLLYKTDGKKIGVLYQFQLKETLPVEKHDIKMDMIVTEKKVIRTD